MRSEPAPGVKLAFLFLLPMLDYLAIMQGEKLGPASVECSLLCSGPWEACAFLSGDGRRMDGEGVDSR